MKTFTVTNRADLSCFFRDVEEHLAANGPFSAVIGDIEQSLEEKKRTISQNASLHKYCDNIANGMNDAGIMQRELVGRFKDGFELPVSMHMVKDIFREVGKAMFKKESTKDLTTIEIQEVYRVVDQRFAEITGVRSEWPSLETLRNEQEKRYKKKPNR